MTQEHSIPFEDFSWTAKPSWSNEGNYYENYGDDNIHAYMISSGYPRVALDWNAADDSITASPLCQVFPHGFKG